MFASYFGLGAYSMARHIQHLGLRQFFTCVFPAKTARVPGVPANYDEYVAYTSSVVWPVYVSCGGYVEKQVRRITGRRHSRDIIISHSTSRRLSRVFHCLRPPDLLTYSPFVTC